MEEFVAILYSIPFFELIPIKRMKGLTNRYFNKELLKKAM